MDKPKNLREQIEKIACERINPEWYRAAGFPRAVVDLCANAFVYQWPESVETRALRRAALLFHSPGWVDMNEPAVE